jgi:hypothetical protein
VLGALATAVAACLLTACAGPSAGPAVRPSAPAGPTAPSPGSVRTPAPAVPLRPGETRVGLELPHGSYRPQAPHGGSDDYRCFLLDPRLTSPAFLTGVAFTPGNPAIVHHAILYRATPAQVSAARAKDAAPGGTGWTCFGDPGLPAGAGDPVASLDDASWLAGWAPGTGEQLFPAGFGMPLAAGSMIVLQVHYNLRAGGGTDDSHVLLRLAPGSAHLRALHTSLLVAPVELPCPPGRTGPLCDRGTSILDLMSRFGRGAGTTVAGLQMLCGGSLTAPRAGPTQSCDRRVTRTETILAVAGHMHLLGRSITVELDPGTPRARVLFSRPVWDFDDQRAQVLAVPVTVRPGDRLRVTCTHDATLRDRLPELKGLPPRYVTWGAGTTDEMCLGILLAADGAA